MKTLALVPALAIVLVATAAPARAEYFLPPPAERLWVLADANAWSVSLRKPLPPERCGPDEDWGADITITRGGTRWTLPVNLLWLADRTASDSICTGGYRQVTRAALAALAERRPAPRVLVELCASEKDGPLFVAGIWACDAAGTYERAVDAGLPWMCYDPVSVKAQGADAVRAMAEAISDSSWKAIEARR